MQHADIVSTPELILALLWQLTWVGGLVTLLTRVSLWLIREKPSFSYVGLLPVALLFDFGIFAWRDGYGSFVGSTALIVVFASCQWLKLRQEEQNFLQVLSTNGLNFAVILGMYLLRDPRREGLIGPSHFAQLHTGSNCIGCSISSTHFYSFSGYSISAAQSSILEWVVWPVILLTLAISPLFTRSLWDYWLDFWEWMVGLKLHPSTQ